LKAARKPMSSRKLELTSRPRAGAIPQRVNLSVAKAIHQVVVDHADRLHESVTDGGADEVEASALQVFAHGIGLGGTRRHLMQRAPGVLAGLSAHKLPDVGIKASELLLHFEKCLGVPDGRFNLQPITDDAGIGQQLLDFLPAVAGNHKRVKAIKRHAVVLSLLQDGVPTQASLGAFQNKKLEEPLVIVQGRAPLLVMVMDGEVVGGPMTASNCIGRRAL